MISTSATGEAWSRYTRTRWRVVLSGQVMTCAAYSLPHGSFARSSSSHSPVLGRDSHG